jgi:hypothetical protein
MQLNDAVVSHTVLHAKRLYKYPVYVDAPLPATMLQIGSASWIPSDHETPCKRTLMSCLIIVGSTSMTGCEKKTKFDKVASVEVCELVSSDEAARIIHSDFTAKSSGPRYGFVGSCKWSFRQSGKIFSKTSPYDASIDVFISNTASSKRQIHLKKFFELDRQERHTVDGITPWELEDIGTQALLYQKLQPDQSSIMIRQSDTLISLEAKGASASQLYEFAKILATRL